MAILDNPLGALAAIEQSHGTMSTVLASQSPADTPTPGACLGHKLEINQMCSNYCKSQGLCVGQCKGIDVHGRCKVYGACEPCKSTEPNSLSPSETAQT